VLDQNHILAEEVVLHQLAVVLNFLSSPALMLLIFVAWLFLAVKCRNYIAAQLRVPKINFSSTVLRRYRRLVNSKPGSGVDGNIYTADCLRYIFYRCRFFFRLLSRADTGDRLYHRARHVSLLWPSPIRLTRR